MSWAPTDVDSTPSAMSSSTDMSSSSNSSSGIISPPLKAYTSNARGLVATATESVRARSAGDPPRKVSQPRPAARANTGGDDEERLFLVAAVPWFLDMDYADHDWAARDDRWDGYGQSFDD